MVDNQEEIDSREADARTNVDAVAWNPDGTLLAVSSGIWFSAHEAEDLWTQVVNVATGQVIAATPHDGAGQLIWSPAGEILYISSSGGAIQRYNITTGMVEAALPARDFREWYRMEHMSLRPDGTLIATIFTRLGGTQQFTIVDAQTLQPVETVDLDFNYKDENALAWIGYSPDGTLLATTTWDGLVRICDPNTLALLKTLPTAPNDKRLYAGDWSADGRLAVGGEDRQVTVWDVSTDQILKRLDTSHVWSLRWHPDRRQLAVYGNEIWDTVTGQRGQSLVSEGSRPMDWSPTGVLAQGRHLDGRLPIAPDISPLGTMVSLITVPPLPMPPPA